PALREQLTGRPTAENPRVDSGTSTGDSTMPRPLLAISTGPLWRLELERAFEVVSEAGAEGVEVMVTQSAETQSPNDLERLAQRFDLPILAVHAPQLLLTRNVFTTNQLEKVRRTADLCNALDVRTVVLH